MIVLAIILNFKIIYILIIYLEIFTIIKLNNLIEIHKLLMVE